MPNGPRLGPYPCPGGVQGRPIGQPGTITNLYQCPNGLILRQGGYPPQPRPKQSGKK